MCHDWKPEDPAVFQDENGQIGCKTCPADTSTLGVGSSPAGLRFLGQDVQSLFGWCVFLMDHDQRHDGSILAKPSGFDSRKDPIFLGGGFEGGKQTRQRVCWRFGPDNLVYLN